MNLRVLPHIKMSGADVIDLTKESSTDCIPSVTGKKRKGPESEGIPSTCGLHITSLRHRITA